MDTPSDPVDFGEQDALGPRAAGPFASPPGEPTFEQVVRRLDELWTFGQRDNVSPALTNSPHHFGKYLVHEVIGSGSFGVIYRARDVELNRDVSLKLPRPAVLHDDERLTRFRNEAVAAASLNHPGIVPVYEADLAASVPYIVSALIEGPDLGRWLEDQREPIGVRAAATFVARLAEAVHYAHEHNVLHRDLKPANVLLESSAGAAPTEDLSQLQPRLTDFGLAKLVEASLQETRSSLLVGTPAYMAPEQLLKSDAKPSPATDVYALGAILYELLTLQPPFEGSTYVEVLDNVRLTEPRPPSELNQLVAQDLDTICENCLNKEPSERYPTAAALKDDLERFLGGQPITAKPTTLYTRWVRWCRQPQRISTAGWFTCWYVLLSTLWMWLLGFGVAFVGATQGKNLAMAVDMLFVTLVFSLPLALLGWFVMRRRSRPAFWFGLILSGIQFATMVHSLFQEGVFFAYLYPNAFSKLSSYVMLLIGSTMQIGLYLLAIPACLRLQTRQE